jgi:hypothetical protein
MLQTFSDPAITGGVVGAVIILAKLLEPFLGKLKPSQIIDGNGGKISEAEWRGRMTAVLERLTDIGEQQTSLLREHYDACNVHHANLREKIENFE